MIGNYVLNQGYSASFSCRYSRSVKLTEETEIDRTSESESIAVGNLQYELISTNAIPGGLVEILIKPIHTFKQIQAK